MTHINQAVFYAALKIIMQLFYTECKEEMEQISVEIHAETWNFDWNKLNMICFIEPDLFFVKRHMC